jgi:pyridoxine 5-phosphate synthase
VRRLTLSLNAFAILRTAAGARDVDLGVAATMAELAAVDAVRLGVNEDLSPVSEQDIADVRRAVQGFDLAMPVNPTLVKVAMEAQPDRVLLAAEGGDGGLPMMPLDLRGRSVSLAPRVRGLADSGVPVAALVKPEIEAVKVAHNEGVDGVELYSGAIVDLPPADRARELERFGDAARLAAKLRLRVTASGGLGYRSLPDVVESAPSLAGVSVGRAAVARALLVGLDRALRDLRALVG